MATARKDKNGFAPVEKHTTAAWANALGQKPVSNVDIPSIDGVDEAKEYVDSNEK